MTHKFFDDLFGAAISDVDGSIVLWQPSGRIELCGTTDTAADKAVDMDADGDVYFGCALMRHGLNAGSRGKASDAVAIGGLWADIDVMKNGSQKAYPPTRDDAIELAGAVGLPPSFAVWTGGGIHAHWLFSEPLILTTDADRSEAGKLASNWVATLAACAGERGWTVDAVGDLARVLRCPGTRNHKYEPFQDVAYIDELNCGRRYHCPNDFEPMLLAEEYTSGNADSVVTVAAIAIPPSPAAPHAASLAAADSRFRKVWERRRSDLADQTPSSYEMAIANEGVYRGWSDQEIASAFMAWRLAHGEKTAKLHRRDYVQRTIGLARAGKLQSEALNDARTLRPARGGMPQSQTERDEALRQLSDIFGRRVIRWIRHTGEEPIYTLVLLGDSDCELAIRVGNASAVRSHKAFADALYASGIQVTMPANRWPSVTALLLVAQEDITNPDGTLDARVRRWLRAYVADVRPETGEQVAEAIERHKPFQRDETLFVYAQDLHRYIEIGIGVRMKPVKLYDDLRAFGATPRVVADTVNKSTVYYWTIAANLLATEEK
jgi:hypothetical protein